MAERLVRHLRANLVSYIALFFALGGTSFAAVQALPRNSVGSAQIRNHSIKTVDVSRTAVAAVRGRRGARGLRGAKGAKGDSGGKGDAGAQGPAGPTFGRSSFNAGPCTLSTSPATAACASTGAISVPTAGRVLVVASAQWYGDGGRDNGVCYLAVDGNFQGVTGQGPTWFGQDVQAHASQYTPGTVSVTGVTVPVAAGAHTFSLDCAEDVGGGEVTMGPATISAVLLGEG